MAEHHAGVAQFWTPDRDSYTGLGQLYVADPTFKARYDAMGPRLAEYLRDATAAYATPPPAAGGCDHESAWPGSGQ